MNRIIIPLLFATINCLASTSVEIYNKITGKIVKHYSETSCEDYGVKNQKLHVFDEKLNYVNKMPNLDYIGFDKPSLVVSCGHAILGVYDMSIFGYKIELDNGDEWK